jgi:FkbH-like protein
MKNPYQFGLQLRLVDRFGDNGIIAILIGKMVDTGDCYVDTWLMSCRVLGRQVEPTTLNLLAARAKALGAKRLIGEYQPTKKNGMVKEHFAKLGFEPLSLLDGGGARYVLGLDDFSPVETFIQTIEE